MRNLGLVACLLTLGVVISVGARAQDTLAEIKQRGVLVAGVVDDAPPISFFDPEAGRIVGYDVDYLAALAKKLGVKLELRSVTAANRIPELVEHNVDILAAGLSPSETRGQFIDFSTPYLVTGQKFLARRGTVNTLKDLEGKKIGAVVGTPSEGCARAQCEGGTVVPFDDYVQGVQALRQGTIAAFSSDEAILVDLLASLPRGDYEIPDLLLSREEYFLGVRKGDRGLLEFVNRTIAEMQQNGEAKRIRDQWFAPPQELPPPAYGAVLRKAAARPRFLGIVLNGTLYPDTDVSIFALDGKHVGTGRITAVIGEDFYMDVPATVYDFVRPGFLVAMDMTSEMALDILIRRQNLLKEVKRDAEKREEQLTDAAYQQALEQEQQAREMDRLREQNRLLIQRERSLYFRYR
ncbi:MAG: transporter substrate-binding domain-containing protein, partial [Proteobacteria bacterium]|nr:transporter substrate-binding domain-containing protein [Pseudomonadota bacterium]